MSALSAGTLFIFAILAPGFLFVFAFYSLGRLTREDYQYGLIFDTGAIVSVSLFSHLIFGTAYFYLAGVLWSDFWSSIEIARSASMSEIFKNHFAPVFLIMMYPVIISAMSFIIGGFLIREVERGRFFPFRYIGAEITHGPIYQAVGFGGGSLRYINVSVLTNINFSGKYVIYEGRAVDVVLGRGNRIVSVTIEDPSRRLIKMKDDNFDTIDDKYSILVHDKRGTVGHIFIGESNIVNVVFIKKTTIFSEEIKS